MSAYATLGNGFQPLRLVKSRSELDQVNLVELMIDQLAARVADRIVAQIAAAPDPEADHWLDSNSAAQYLGISRHSVRRLAAEGSLPTEQAGANCKLYFRRSDLDDWRRGSPKLTNLRRVA